LSGFLFYIVTAIGIILIIEGLLYALFPDRVRRMMALALTMEPAKLRYLGALMAISGFLLVGLLQGLAGG